MKFLIIGLGNPGKKYSHNRHNIGFMALDVLSRHFHCSITEKFKKSHMARIEKAKETILLMKPQTYMNASGDMVRKAVATYRIPLSHVIVIHDDIDFPLGKIKIRKNGSSGGHNGVQSILDSLQNENFIRIRMGIHAVSRRDTPLDEYVLSDFNKSELETVKEVLMRIPDIIDKIILESIDKAMNEFN